MVTIYHQILHIQQQLCNKKMLLKVCIILIFDFPYFGVNFSNEYYHKNQSQNAFIGQQQYIAYQFQQKNTIMQELKSTTKKRFYITEMNQQLYIYLKFILLYYISLLNYLMKDKNLENQNITKLTANKQSFLDKFFAKIKFESRVTHTYRKFSNITATKTTESMKINQSNFCEILTILAQRILRKNENGKDLLHHVKQKLNQKSEQSNESINSMMIKIEYKRGTIDLLTPLVLLKKDIFEEITKKKNPLHKIIFQVWYTYLFDKIKLIQFLQVDDFKQWLSTQLSVFGQFIANSIFHLFGSWFHHIDNKKKQVYSIFLKEFVPHLLTSHKKWKEIYHMILKKFGQRQLKLTKDLTLTNFDIDPKFSCFEMQRPFQRSILAISEFYEQFSTKKKIIKLKEIIDILRNQIYEYQEKMINEKKYSKHYQIDVDNTVSCFTYCILKSGKNGIAQSLDYLEIFYKDPGSLGSEYLEGLGIGHIMASLKSAAVYLRYRDQQICGTILKLTELII